MQQVVPNANSAGNFVPMMKLSRLYTDLEILKSKLVPNESNPKDDSNIVFSPEPESLNK